MATSSWPGRVKAVRAAPAPCSPCAGSRWAAEKIYGQLQHAGVEVLFDDRLARAGEKFSDADLIGIPARLTISKRALEQGKIEFKLRPAPKAELLSLEEVQARLAPAKPGI